MDINNCNYTLHMFLLYKSNKTIWMFYYKSAGEWDNSVNIPYIYNVEIVARVTLIMGSVLEFCFPSPIS